MKLPTVDLEALEGEYAVSLTPAGSPIPEWAFGAGFTNIAACSDELSIVCLRSRVPASVHSDTGWTAIKLSGTFAFDETGVVLSVVKPLSEKQLGVFIVSTFKRDYLLVKTAAFAEAKEVLIAQGHRFSNRG